MKNEEKLLQRIDIAYQNGNEELAAELESEYIALNSE